MPIYSVGDNQNKEAVFGSGDIKVSCGYRKHKENVGILVLRNQEPQAIGIWVEHEKPEEINTTEAPITLAFNKVESIDVLIRNLEKVKQHMLND